MAGVVAAPGGARDERARARRVWRTTTPGRLRLQSVLVAVATAVFMVLGCGALVTIHLTVSKQQQETVTAIVGVQRVHAWLAAADRSAANSYLSGGVEVTLPQQQYEADIAAASSDLEQAAERNPGGQPATERLSSINQLLSEYTRLVDTAMVQHRLANPDGITSLHAASDLMHHPQTGILAQVEALGDLDSAVLARTNLELEVSAAALALFAAAALILVGLLVWTQRFVRRRFRRRRNPRLLAATLAVLVVLAGTGVGAVAAGQSIQQSQAQYGRLLKLWQARSIAYDANGDASLFLIAGPAEGTPFDQAFQASANQLADRDLTDDIVQDARAGIVRFHGMLADEVRDAGSPGERSAALDVLIAYRQFLNVDAEMRSAALAGHQTDAMNLTLGTYGGALGLAFKSMNWGPRLGAQRDWSEGELGFAFELFDWDLAQLTQMLQRQFDASLGDAEQVLEAAIGLQALSLAVVALTFAGVRPRIAEYAT